MVWNWNGWWLFRVHRGWHPTQLYGDYFINQYPYPINQSGFNQLVNERNCKQKIKPTTMFWKRTPLATAKSLITKWKFQIPLFFSNFWLMINILCVSKKLGPPPSKKNIFLWNKETSSLSLSLSLSLRESKHTGGQGYHRWIPWNS